MDAEERFDVAGSRLSVGAARYGADKAIDSWIPREKSIRKAEAAARRM